MSCGNDLASHEEEKICNVCLDRAMHLEASLFRKPMSHDNALEALNDIRVRINNLYTELADKPGVFTTQNMDKAYEVQPLETYVVHQANKDSTIIEWAYTLFNTEGLTEHIEDTELRKNISPVIIDLLDRLGLPVPEGVRESYEKKKNSSI